MRFPRPNGPHPLTARVRQEVAGQGVHEGARCEQSSKLLGDVVAHLHCTGYLRNDHFAAVNDGQWILEIMTVCVIAASSEGFKFSGNKKRGSDDRVVALRDAQQVVPTKKFVMLKQ